MSKVTWERAKETADAYKGSGLFLRLAEDGHKFVGVFVGEPNVRELYFDEKSKTYEKFSPKHKAEGKKPSPKFSINVYQPSHKDGTTIEPRACRIFEMNAVTFKDLLKVKDKYGLEKWKFEVSREGAKGSPKTVYHILPEEKLTDEEAADVKELLAGTTEDFRLHDLDNAIGDDEEKTDLGSADKKKEAAKEKKEPAKEAPPPPAAAAAAAPPPATNGHANGHANGATNGATASAGDVIAPERAAILGERLKAHPNDFIRSFLADFGVGKIKLLAAKDVDRAFATLDKHEGKSAVAEQQVDDDPFS